MPTRIPTSYSRIVKTFIKVANGTIVVTPMRGGDEYWISAPGHRQQRVGVYELSGVVRQLVDLCGGPIPYLPGRNPRWENAHEVVNKLLDIDQPPAKETLIHMGRPTECPHPCHLCGASCTLVHRGTGRDSLIPNEHICSKCDKERFERMLRPYEVTGTHHIPEAHYEDDPEMTRIRKRVAKAKTEREAATMAANPAIQHADDPLAFIQREVKRRSEPIKKLEVRGRRWYRRGAGGVYCKAYIYINDKLVHVTPEQYGYGDHYLTLAKDWLRREGYLEGLLDDERDPLWHLRDKHKIDLQYGVTDVARERDL